MSARALTVLALLAVPASARADACPQVPAPAPTPSSASLSIGMTVVDASSLKAPSFAALRPRSGDPPAVHIYASYEDANLATRLAAVRAYHATGYRTLLTIKAQIANDAPTPTTYSAYVAQILGQVGGSLDAVEITNEGDFPAPPNTSDGETPDIIEDLVAGVLEAKRYATAHHLSLAVGFNWVFDSHQNLNDFWDRLKAQATPEFLRSVGFLGLHTYPNTLSLPTPVDDSIDAAELDGILTARCEMTALGLARSIPIDITEAGYPVPDDSYLSAQADFWQRVLDTVYAYRANAGVERVYVFRYPAEVSLGASDYGIVDPSDAPRPAYAVIKRAIAHDDTAAPGPLPSCTSTRLPARRGTRVPRSALLGLVHRNGRVLVLVAAHAARVTIAAAGTRRVLRVRACHTYRVRLAAGAGHVRVLARVHGDAVRVGI